MPQKKIILAIETSCDETAAAVLEYWGGKVTEDASDRVNGKNDLKHTPSDHSVTPSLDHPFRLLSNIVSSQIKLHAKYGGVVPNLAAREQLKNIEPVLRETLRTAGRSLRDIDYVAVTRGPGLIPSLLVGVNFARALAFALARPLLGINHIEGHIYSNWLPSIASEKVTERGSDEVKGIRHSENMSSNNSVTPSLSHSVSFPVLNLVVSGGHTELILMQGHGKYEIVGETRDDAAGEAFDKVAKLLGLGYPGGPIVSKLAESGNSRAFNFPRPMLGAQNFDFSFSGLKTAVLYTVHGLQSTKHKAQSTKRLRKGEASFGAIRYSLSAIRPFIPDICASFEAAVADTLIEKTIRAAKKFRAKGVFLSGGVSANKKLRTELAERVAKELPGVAYRHPDLAYTGDNAAMIAMAACQQITNGKKRITRNSWRTVEADANLRIA